MARVRLAWVSVVLTLVLPLVAASSAGAQERVYNPGFEFNCALGLQNWTPMGGASAACDVLAHTGSQSLALTGQGAGQTLQGDCITGAGSGSYAGSFWYRNTNAAVSRVAMSVSFYSSLDCSGSAISTPVPIETTSALNDTSWHQVTGTVLAFPGSKSARINLSQGCTSACAAQTVRYDDVSLSSGNRVYNPGFEFNCTLGLQNWVPTGGASPACDPLAHSGSQSLALTGQGFGQTLQSDCITGAGSGSYSGSFWYRNTNAPVTRVSMSLTFYSAIDCSGSPISSSSAIETTSALNDTNWHQLTGTVLAFPGSKSARINLSQGCTSACAAQTVRYDDIALDESGPPPTATVLYDQFNNAAAGFATTSQDYEVSADSFDSFTADDFVIPGGASWSITGVGVDGEYASGPGPAASVNVLFYANGGGNLPSTLVASRTAQAYVQGPAAGDFVVTISPAVTLSPGTYWISVRARQDFGCCGGWFWQNRSVQSNSGAAWQNPANGWGTGCIAWTRRTTCLTGGGGHPDQVFRLLGTSGTPTAVALASFTARAASAGIVVSWRTAAEVSTLGFNVYRQSRGKLVKLNRVLIPSVFGGTATGHAYSWLDRKAPNGAARYRLQAVSLDGIRTWSGSAVAAS